MKQTIVLLLSILLTSFTYANETWDKTKSAINEGAEKIDQGTRKVIKKGKTKWREREAREEQKDRERKTKKN